MSESKALKIVYNETPKFLKKTAPDFSELMRAVKEKNEQIEKISIELKRLSEAVMNITSTMVTKEEQHY